LGTWETKTPPYADATRLDTCAARAGAAGDLCLNTTVVKNSINSPNTPLTKKFITGSGSATPFINRKYEKIDPTAIPITIPFHAQCSFSPDAPIANPITALFNKTHTRATTLYFRIPAWNDTLAHTAPASNPNMIATRIRFIRFPHFVQSRTTLVV
jgi:hypothetical protein